MAGGLQAPAVLVGRTWFLVPYQGAFARLGWLGRADWRSKPAGRARRRAIDDDEARPGLSQLVPWIARAHVRPVDHLGAEVLDRGGERGGVAGSGPDLDDVAAAD